MKRISLVILSAMLLLWFFPKEILAENILGRVLDIHLHYSNSNITITTISGRPGSLPSPKTQRANDYSLVVFNEKQQEIFSTEFAFPLVVFSDDFSQNRSGTGSSQILTNSDQTVTIPLDSQARKIQILDKIGKTVASQNISIPVDQNTKSQQSQSKNKISPMVLLVGSGILTLFLVIFIAIKLIKKRKNQPPSMPQTDQQTPPAQLNS